MGAMEVLLHLASLCSTGAVILEPRRQQQLLSSSSTIRPGQPMFDTQGHQIDAHGGGFLLDAGTYFWFGSARLNHTDAGCTTLPPHPCDKGINLYSSTDLLSWKFESLVVHAMLTAENGLDLERPKVVRCKAGRYVMWLRGTPIYNGTLLKVGVLSAPNPRGPWEWEWPHDLRRGRHHANGDPFHLVADKYQYGDATLWSDPSSPGAHYVYWRARTSQDGFRAMRLDEQCTGVVPQSDTQLFRSPNREAPAFFSHDGNFYLWTSGTLGWTPVQGYVYKGPTPLGPFNASLGHGWHAYYKGPDWNVSQRYCMRDGYLPGGHDWRNATTTTLPAAKALCARSSACRGITFKAHDQRPAANVSIKVSFKTRATFVPEGDPEGLQPSPIPEPGAVGNRKDDGQPGILSYGSQSTFILPNPKWTPGSRLAQFIYMADRWKPNSVEFGLYVWLPLFIDPRNPSRVSVVWHDAWQLDNATSPFGPPAFKTDDSDASAGHTGYTGRCSCANTSLCLPLQTPLPLHETFVAMIHERTVPHLNYSVPTTLFIGSTLGTAVLDPAVICAAHAHGVRVITSIGVGEGDLGSFNVTLIGNTTSRQQWIHRVMYGDDSAAGIVQMFDIERYTGDAAQLTLLVSELATALRAWNPRSQLSFALSVFPDSQANFYDHLAISRLVDYIFVMAYDEWPYESFPHKTNIAAANSDLQALRNAVAEYTRIGVSPTKLVIGLPWYGNDFLCADNITRGSKPAPGSPCDVVPHSRTTIKQRAVLDQFSLMNHKPALMHDNASVSIVFDYQCTNISKECPSGQPNVNNTKHGRHQVWYDAADTLREKYQTCRALGVRGVGVYAVDFVDYITGQGRDNWEALADTWPRID